MAASVPAAARDPDAEAAFGAWGVEFAGCTRSASSHALRREPAVEIVRGVEIGRKSEIKVVVDDDIM